MKTITLTSNAKVNLALDVLGREQRPAQRTSQRSSSELNCYHLIQTVLHEITPQNTAGFKSDLVTIQVEEAAHAGNTSNADKHKILIFCDDPSVPTDKTNLAYRAAQTILTCSFMRAHKTQPVKSHGLKIAITIEKHIPVSRGLGGGSSNAAATLKGLNKLLALNLDNATLRAIAAEVGMDVPFFIEGGVALGEHFGEQITPLPPVKGLAFTFFPGTRPAHPSTRPARALKKTLSKKTEKAYAALDLSLCGKNTAQTKALIHAIKTNDTATIMQNLHNDFETLPEYASAGVPANSALPENRHLTGAGPGYFLVS